MHNVVGGKNISTMLLGRLAVWRSADQWSFSRSRHVYSL